MENHEFDQALRDFANGSALPYDPLQWDRMAGRLDAHGDGPGALTRQQIIPFLPWTLSTAAACLVVLTLWLMPSTPSTIHPAQQLSIAHQSTPVAEQQVSDMQKPEPVKPVQHATSIPTRHFPPAEKSSLPGKALLAASVAVQPEARIATSDSVPARGTNAVDKSNTVATKVNPFILSPELPEKEAMHAGRKTAFGVHGGYNIGQLKNNFTVGLSVKQKLSERFNIETGIAVVTGGYQTSRETANMTSGFGASPAKTVEPVSTNVTYLQAAPSLNYRIYRGLSAGGGMDAQRLLSKNPKTVTINNFGDSEETDAQAEWDFGLTARMDMQVAKKLRAGMMYRESVHRVSKGPQDAAGRNYLLLQLSYTIY